MVATVQYHFSVLMLSNPVEGNKRTLNGPKGMYFNQLMQCKEIWLFIFIQCKELRLCKKLDKDLRREAVRGAEAVLGPATVVFGVDLRREAVRGAEGVRGPAAVVFGVDLRREAVRGDKVDLRREIVQGAEAVQEAD